MEDLRAENSSGDLLAVLQKALARILQEENPLPSHLHQARQAELSRRLHGDVPSPSPASRPLQSQDLTIISRLLHQVRLLMEEERGGGEVLSKLERDQRPGLDHVNAGAEKTVMEAVVEIASTAAEAAKAAAASSGKNLEVMETLLAKSKKSTRPKRTHAECHGGDEEESSRHDVDDKDDQGHGSTTPIKKNLLKNLERQNTITHWILGFMVIGTAIWRFKIVSMIMGVRQTVTNPFQAIGNIMSEGFNGTKKEDANSRKGFEKARTVLPSFLGSEEEFTKKTQTSTKEDFKIGEALTLPFDNLLHAGKSTLSGSDKKEDSSTE